ncbi:MAG: sulfite reductase, ferredoxin dependent, partial [Cyanobium sp.]
MSPTRVSNSPTPAPARTAAETLKLESGHLRDPLLAELDGEEGAGRRHFGQDAVSILKFHGSYQQDDRDRRQKGQEKDWQMMLRLRSPGGRIPASLYLALDALADRLGNGTLRATTRQAFQMHGIAKANLREVIGTIVRAMGSTLSACGDINRNVM